MDATRFDRISRRFAARRLSRRDAARHGTAGLAAGLLATTGLARAAAQGATPRASSEDRQRAGDIVAITREEMVRFDLRAVILRATIDGEEVITEAMGESIAGVPATPDMRFRNGAVAISYMATLLLQLVDRQVMGLDDPLATWMPDLPDAERVTLRMLANMTAGYPDYVRDDGFIAALYADPFRQWAPEELVAVGTSTPRVFEPGTNWDYSHTNYVILGLALERITGTPLDALLRQRVLDPLGLTGTTGSATAAMAEPVLHAFSSERRAALGIDPAARFSEESTFWNPSWTLAQGAVQSTTIHDMTATAEAIGTGALLSPEAHRAQIAPGLLGFGAVLEGCPTCHTIDERYNYGLGVVLNGPWILQNPLFGGYGAVEAYLPSRKIAIAVVTTFNEGSFDETGAYKYGNASQNVFNAIGAYLAPDEAPPGRR